MKFGMQLAQSTVQKLSLTAELRQSVHILQLAGQELSEYLQEQAMENPVLEIETYTEYTAKKSTLRSQTRIDPLSLVAKAMSDTLETSLLKQIRLQGVNGELYRASAYWAGNLDESGYVTVDISEVSRMTGVSAEVALKALQTLQTMEPAGVCARNLQECLLLQIRRNRQSPHGAERLVTDCLQELALCRWERISAKLVCTQEMAREIASFVRTLDPRPGARFHSGLHSAVTPDAYVYESQEGIKVEINPASMPKISVNRDYYWDIQRSGCLSSSEFIKGKLKDAMWLVRSLRQRRITISKVIFAILQEQPRFIRDGVQGLRPLTLKTIADRLSLHESTISRAVNQKYVNTPHGVFELKYFFSAGLPNSQGENISITRVKAKLTELVAQESKNKPYSDQKLAQLLGDAGIQISRRTVTKYREELQILNSMYRKGNENYAVHNWHA